MNDAPYKVSKIVRTEPDFTVEYVTITESIAPNTRVKYNEKALGISGNGWICGIAQEPLPPLGRSYIIKHDFDGPDISESYLQAGKYTHFTAFESHFDVVIDEG